MTKVKESEWSAKYAYAKMRRRDCGKSKEALNVGRNTATPDAMAHAQKIFETQGNRGWWP